MSTTPFTLPAPEPIDRAATNRANSQRSTGPRTATGKQRSSLNALRHGLTGQTVVLPSEDHAAYDHFVRRFTADLKPKGALEEQLVQTVAETSWRLNRIAALETNLLTLGLTEHAGTIDVAHPEAHAALATASSYREHASVLANLSMHENRLSRYLERTLKQLREIQTDRRSQESKQMVEAAKLKNWHENREDTPYDPTADGFVFSNDEIDTFANRTQRRARAYRAT